MLWSHKFANDLPTASRASIVEACHCHSLSLSYTNETFGSTLSHSWWCDVFVRVCFPRKYFFYSNIKIVFFCWIIQSPLKPVLLHLADKIPQMGVDIAVKTDIKYLGNKKPEHYEEKDEGFFMSVGIFQATKFDALGGMKPGWYSFKYDFDEMEMYYHIGYASHMQMKEGLARLCKEYDVAQNGSVAPFGSFPYNTGVTQKGCGAFYEFITMDDAGGLFMTPVCAKLAKDLESFRDEAKRYFSGENNIWMKRYDALYYLFNKAACTNGALILS